MSTIFVQKKKLELDLEAAKQAKDNARVTAMKKQHDELQAKWDAQKVYRDDKPARVRDHQNQVRNYREKDTQLETSIADLGNQIADNKRYLDRMKQSYREFINENKTEPNVKEQFNRLHQ